MSGIDRTPSESVIAAECKAWKHDQILRINIVKEDRGESIGWRSLKPWPAGSVAGCAAGEHQTDGRSSGESYVSEMEQ